MTTLLGSLLAEAEAMFGPRDKDYTPLGVEFSGDRPQLWYPGNRKHVSIILTDSARTDTDQAIFQLAHEVFHLLSPSGGARAPVVEEGLAAIFQQNASEKYDLGYKLVSKPYLEAARLTNQLLKRDPDIIKRLRSKTPAFFDWTPRMLVSETGIDLKLAAQLCEPYLEFEGRF
ncbi:MAG: hypothetical protein AAF412_01115 [Pseudomonadota bacterium]